MADRIAVMSQGVLQAFDTPEDLYDRPKTLFVAGFVGNPPMNFTDVRVAADNGHVMARSDALGLAVPQARAEKVLKHGGTVRMGIRPEDIHVVDGDDGLVGEVNVVEPLGRDDLLDVRIGGEQFLVLADPHKRIRAGNPVRLRFDMDNVQFFDIETERSLLWN